MNGLLGNLDQSQIQQLLSALQGGGFGQLFGGMRGRGGGMGQSPGTPPVTPTPAQPDPTQGAYPATSQGLVPFGFSPPMVPQSQFQPYQWMTGQAQGIDPMALFNQSLGQVQANYGNLGTPGVTPPPTTPPPTTLPPTTPPGQTPGTQQYADDMIAALLRNLGGRNPFAGDGVSM